MLSRGLRCQFSDRMKKEEVESYWKPAESRAATSNFASISVPPYLIPLAGPTHSHTHAPLPNNPPPIRLLCFPQSPPSMLWSAMCRFSEGWKNYKESPSICSFCFISAAAFSVSGLERGSEPSLTGSAEMISNQSVSPPQWCRNKSQKVVSCLNGEFSAHPGRLVCSTVQPYNITTMLQKVKQDHSGVPVHHISLQLLERPNQVRSFWPQGKM